MFTVIKSYKKKFIHCHVNDIHMHIIAFCVNFSTIACCLYTVTQWFVPVCTKHHSRI